MCLSDETYFTITQIFDQYLASPKRDNSPLDQNLLHKIAIVCIFIACKFQEVCPISIVLATTDLGHSKYLQEDLLDFELKILDAIEFRIKPSSIYTESSLALQYLLSSERLSHSINSKIQKQIQETLLVLCKIHTFFPLFTRSQQKYQSLALLRLAITLSAEIPPSQKHKASKKSEYLKDELLQAFKNKYIPDRDVRLEVKLSYNMINKAYTWLKKDSSLYKSLFPSQNE